MDDDFATLNEGATISVSDGQGAALADAKFTSANSPLIIDTFFDGHVPGGYGKFFEGISFNNDGTKMYLSDEALVSVTPRQSLSITNTRSLPPTISQRQRRTINA